MILRPKSSLIAGIFVLIGSIIILAICKLMSLIDALIFGPALLLLITIPGVLCRYEINNGHLTCWCLNWKRYDIDLNGAAIVTSRYGISVNAKRLHWIRPGSREESLMLAAL